MTALLWGIWGVPMPRIGYPHVCLHYPHACRGSAARYAWGWGVLVPVQYGQCLWGGVKSYTRRPCQLRRLLFFLSSLIMLVEWECGKDLAGTTWAPVSTTSPKQNLGMCALLLCALAAGVGTPVPALPWLQAGWLCPLQRVRVLKGDEGQTTCTLYIKCVLFYSDCIMVGPVESWGYGQQALSKAAAGHAAELLAVRSWGCNISRKQHLIMESVGSATLRRFHTA